MISMWKLHRKRTSKFQAEVVHPSMLQPSHVGCLLLWYYIKILWYKGRSMSTPKPNTQLLIVIKTNHHIKSTICGLQQARWLQYASLLWSWIWRSVLELVPSTGMKQALMKSFCVLQTTSHCWKATFVWYMGLAYHTVWVTHVHVQKLIMSWQVMFDMIHKPGWAPQECLQFPPKCHQPYAGLALSNGFVWLGLKSGSNSEHAGAQWSCSNDNL